MAETQTSKLPGLGTRSNEPAERPDAGPKSSYRCQWCMVDLQPGVEVCPTCGSRGIDTSMVVPGAEPATSNSDPAVVAVGDGELDEWWNDDGEEEYRNSASVDEDRTPVIIGLFGTVIVCIIVGVIIAPMFLTSVFESSLGVTVEDPNDLRPLGGVLGMLVGAFIGTIGMWVTAPRR